MASIILDGYNLSTDELDIIGDFSTKVELSHDAWKRINNSRAVIDNTVTNGKTVYGVNTGYGTQLCATIIPKHKIKELNINLIRSHAVGVGEILSPQLTRRLLAMQISGCALGYKGVSENTVQTCLACLNNNCLPTVPVKGTVGCHDFAQLAHLCLGMMGEGKMWSPKTGIAPAASVLELYGLEPLSLLAGEAISMINGTNFVLTLAVEALKGAKAVVETADVISAVSIEGLVGTPAAFDRDIHAARPHKGQIKVARKIRSLLGNHQHKSEICDTWPISRVQDPYTFRCIPQVHGISHDIVDFSERIITDELTSSHANPMTVDNTIINNGNFHGEYLAKALDYLAIGIHELGNISERRIERLCNPSCSELAPFLAVESGLNNGFMMAHVTASALVSENKTYCHPASVDSIPTAANYEDHVSMGGWGARKALLLIKNVSTVLAIELLAACQAIDLRRPLKSTPVLEQVHAYIRQHSTFLEKDRVLAEEIETVADLIINGQIWEIVKDHIESYTET